MGNSSSCEVGEGVVAAAKGESQTDEDILMALLHFLVETAFFFLLVLVLCVPCNKSGIMDGLLCRGHIITIITGGEPGRAVVAAGWPTTGRPTGKGSAAALRVVIL